MNSLSWILYLIEILDSLKGLTIGISAVLTIIAIISIPSFFGYMENGELNYAKKTAYVGIGSLLAVLLVSLIGVLIPSKETMYLIAASELGEEIVTDPKAIQLYDKVDTIINNELDKLLKKDEK